MCRIAVTAATITLFLILAATDQARCNSVFEFKTNLSLLALPSDAAITETVVTEDPSGATGSSGSTGGNAPGTPGVTAPLAVSQSPFVLPGGSMRSSYSGNSDSSSPANVTGYGTSSSNASSNTTEEGSSFLSWNDAANVPDVVGSGNGGILGAATTDLEIPTTGHAPEPLTIMGILGGCAALGAYLRRR